MSFRSGGGGGGGRGARPFPIVLVKCWKVARWDAKNLLKKIAKNPKNCNRNFKSCHLNFLIFLYKC